jgi:hypothetical protein
MAYVRCASCQTPLTDKIFHGDTATECGFCGRTIRAFLLPKLYQSASAAPPSLPVEAPAEGESTCFYSPNRKATKVCGHCGVFVSDAWAAQWGSETVCLKCLEQLRSKNVDQRFEASRKLWDNIALGMIVVPFVVAFLLLCTLIGYPFAFMVLMLTLFTAPAAIFIALRYWNAPRSLVPRGRMRLVLALLFGVFLLCAWTAGIWAIVYQIMKS